MKQKLLCPIKINLTLRILSTRDDGYHEIYSLFWKKKGIDGLTIRPDNDNNTGDVLNVKGLTIKGKNIIMEAVNWARSLKCDFPPLQLELEKNVPIGSGIGAGSGNAAALISWLVKEFNLNFDAELISALGSDVPFMSGNSDMAIVSGIGEKVFPINNQPDLKCVLVFPKWQISTSKAYSDLDRYRQTNSLVKKSQPELNEEISIILKNLNKGNKVGLLPNDFLTPLLEQYPEYYKAQNIAENSGAVAWGLSGSGSAFFALCKDSYSANNAVLTFRKENWIKQINKLE